MARAINPPFTFEKIGDINLEAYAGGANAELLPGRARLQVAHGPGGISGGGLACASHLGAVAPEGGNTGFSPEMAAQIKRYTGRDVAATDDASTVFRVFSPNLNVWQGGGMAGPLEVRHGGVGGWPRNAASQVLIELTGTPPADLAAGDRYEARAYVTGDGEAATGGGFFTSWRGRLGRVADPKKPDELRACRQSMAAMRAQLQGLGVPFDDTLGREFQAEDCESNLRLVDGTSRSVTAGALSGYVTIEAITANRVVGSFELAGQATVVVTEHRPEKLDDTDEHGGSMSISGRFMAPSVRGTGFSAPGIRAARVEGDDPQPGAGFAVTAQTPGPDRRNVSWTPDIRLRFSEAVDPGSLRDGAVTLGYRKADGTMEDVDVSLALAAPDEVAVVTADRLRDGVRYRLTAPAGGLESANGAVLGQEHASDFTTMVDLNDDEQMIFQRPGLGGRFTPKDHFLADWREGIETNIYQVSANEPLIVNKPTAARVYVKWRPDPDVHADWQADAFRAHVRGLSDSDRDLFEPARNVRIRRLDLYDTEDRRAAKNTVNLYGWTPADTHETSAVRIDLEPADQCGQPEVFTAERDVDWSDLRRNLEIAYYIARVGPWRDGVPDWAISEARRIARTSADYTTQIFPVGDTALAFAGVMRFSDADHREMAAHVARGNAGGVRNYIMESTHDRLEAAGRTDTDVWLVFTPFSWLEVAGRAQWDLGVDFDAAHAKAADARFRFPTIQMTITEGLGDTPLVSAMQLITHELGHIYGLDHEPYVANTDHREQVCDNAKGERYPGIEGFRVESDGFPGFNKSTTEGNAAFGGGLKPLMFPCGGPFAEFWITRTHYSQLIDNMTELGARSPR